MTFGTFAHAYHLPVFPVICVKDTEDDGKLLFTHEYCRVQCMVAIIPPSAAMVAATIAAGLASDAGADLDTNSASQQNATSSTAATVALEQFLSPVDQLLIVDHMYRIRLFRFGYTAPGTGATGDSAAAAIGTSTAASGSARGGGPSNQEVDLLADPRGAIIVALQNALFPPRVVGRGGPIAGSGAGSVLLAPPPPPPPATSGINIFPMRQTTSDSNFGLLGIGRHQMQAASTPGSVVGMAPLPFLYVYSH